jgi:hypothetical protein
VIVEGEPSFAASPRDLERRNQFIREVSTRKIFAVTPPRRRASL